MTDRAELIEATLDSLPEGVAVLGEHGEILFWNRAAEAITGHKGIDVLARPYPDSLKPLLLGNRAPGQSETSSTHEAHHGFIARAPHKLGHQVAAMARTLVLRDGMGARLGSAVLFHPAESLDAVPHGDSGEDGQVETSQADLEDRLDSLFEDFSRDGQPFGVLWILVDQAAALRTTHGPGACEAMVEKVGRSLSQGLRPTEYLGRWGQDEFLVISHERTQAMLAVHAQTLAGLARTADFRWWGDRISLTVSIGAAQAGQAGTLADLLEKAKASMTISFHAGGNHITCAPRRQSCSPS